MSIIIYEVKYKIVSGHGLGLNYYSAIILFIYYLNLTLNLLLYALDIFLRK